MKNFSFIAIFLVIAQTHLVAQAGKTISYVSPDIDCSVSGNATPTILNFSSTSGGRHSYSDGSNLTISYVSGQWRIQLGPNNLFTNSFQSTPNPPSSSTGTWVNSTATCPVANFSFTGTGTQTTLTLPIELVNFNIKFEVTKNYLTWTTASEKNNQGFDIERSLDGTDFQKIGFVKGNGTTNLPQQYTYTDALVNGVTYFKSLYIL
jgi:hypothetical protein